MKYFQTLTNELQLNKHLFTHYYNIPHLKQRQSSVAIIFKLNKPIKWTQAIRKQIQSLYDNTNSQQSVCSQSLLNTVLQNTTDKDIQMLFAQRTTNQADFNSGNVCFPGGKSDGEESDLSACIREVREEVGITLLSKQSQYHNLYLGKFKYNFFYRKTKRQKVYISCHLFLILNPNVTMILNSAQVFEHLCRFMTPDGLTFIKWSKENITGLSSFPWPLKYLQNSIKNNLNYVKYSAIEVDLGSPLWGLSLHIYLHMLRIISKKLPKEQSKQLDKRIKLGQTFTADFNKFYPLSYPCQWFISHWNKKNRINAFKQPPVKQSSLKTILYLFIIAIIAYLVNLYFNN